VHIFFLHKNVSTPFYRKVLQLLCDLFFIFTKSTKIDIFDNYFFSVWLLFKFLLDKETKSIIIRYL